METLKPGDEVEFIDCPSVNPQWIGTKARVVKEVQGNGLIELLIISFSDTIRMPEEAIKMYLSAPSTHSASLLKLIDKKGEQLTFGVE